LNLLLLDEDDLDGSGGARVRGRRARHVVEVLRAAPGDRIAVGLLRGRTGEAVVLEASPDLVLLSVNLGGEPPPPSPVALVLALPRPKILRKVLQAAAGMGVKRLALVGTYRVEKSYFASPLLAPEAIEAELRLGLEQGKDTVPPEVTLHRYFKPFVEDDLDGLFPPDRRARLIAHPGAPALLDSVPAGADGAVLAIGPEGGFTTYEASTLVTRGFHPFSFGPRPLRVDVAVPFAVAQAELSLRRHGPRPGAADR
jgi:16S rRNA (uracil1498-N3)-methyltransferase